MDSKNIDVQAFLNDIETVDKQKYLLLNKLRQIVFEHYDEIGERMMYGGIMFSLDGDLGGLFVRKNHISFEFAEGFLMNDPRNMLEGKGKYRRHLKIRTLADIANKDVEFFVKQLAKDKCERQQHF